MILYATKQELFIRLLRASTLIKNSLLFRHWGIVPKGQSFWDENAINKFKELIEKYNETGMIAIIKGIEPGPNEEVYRIILVASATAEVSIHRNSDIFYFSATEISEVVKQKCLYKVLLHRNSDIF